MQQRIAKLQNQKNTMVETMNGSDRRVTVIWKNCSQIWQRYVRSLFNLCTTLSVETFIYAQNTIILMLISMPLRSFSKMLAHRNIFTKGFDSSSIFLRASNYISHPKNFDFWI
jgi:hypothetical protein